MDITFKEVLENTMQNATGGNRGKAMCAVENWTQSFEGNSIPASTTEEYEKLLIARYIYAFKINAARKNHTIM